MLMNIMNKLLVVSLCLVMMGCSQEGVGSNSEADSLDRKTLGNVSPQTVGQAPVGALPPSQGPSPLVRGEQPPPPLQAPPAPPPLVFMPSVQDIEVVFLNALSATYASMPARTPQEQQVRQQWYSNESKKLAQVRVMSCSQSTAGTASVCRIQFGGSVNDVKLMYTERGWQLVF